MIVGTLISDEIILLGLFLLIETLLAMLRAVEKEAITMEDDMVGKMNMFLIIKDHLIVTIHRVLIDHPTTGRKWILDTMMASITVMNLDMMYLHITGTLHWETIRGGLNQPTPLNISNYVNPEWRKYYFTATGWKSSPSIRLFTPKNHTAWR